MRQIDHFISIGSPASSCIADVMDPNNGGVQAWVALGDAAALKRPVEANMDDLARLLSSEHGKVIADSKGDIQRGLEVIEFCCGIPHMLKGEYTQGEGPGIDLYSMRQSIGIGARTTPFNFPGMIALWMSGPTIATGNAFIIPTIG